MALVTEMELPEFDYTDPALTGANLHETLLGLADRDWICQGPLGYIVLDREAGELFLRTRSASFPGNKLAELFGVTEGPLYEEMRRNILHIGGDHHRRLRNLVNPAFTPRAADRWRPAMRGFLEELMAPVLVAGRCELVDAVCKPYPSLTIATLMGAPLEDAPRLHNWSNWIQRQFDPPSLMNEREGIESACIEFYDWAHALLEQRRGELGEDLISTLIAAEQDGDRLSDVELVNLVLNVLVGGVDTTQSQLAQAVRLFCAHPEQWDLLAREPERVPAAVDEVLRFEPITPFTARIVEEEMELRGVTFPVGTVVMVCALTGNRDLPPGTPDPRGFDITADRGGAKPLTFGAGIHYCLGANLARAELQEALTYMAPRMPGLRLDGEVELGTVQGIYGVDSLPIAFDPAT